MAYTSAQIQEALRRSGFNRTANASDMRAANKFGLNVFARSRANIGRTTGPGSSAPTATVEAPDITQQFIDGLKPYLTSEKKPNVTPFDQAGFYDEKDARALADQEYDPYYQRIKEEQDRQNAAQDYGRLEEVNASGGFRSSAFQQEQDRRKLALQRASTEQDTQKRLAKEQFTQSRRGEAYSRYLQSIGAVTS